MLKMPRLSTLFFNNIKDFEKAARFTQEIRAIENSLQKE